MGFSFGDVYRKAIALFDDPKITKAYETSQVQFNKLMYTFLQNAISMFNNPLSISIRLAEYTEPKGTMEIFESDGETQTFQLSDDFELMENSVYDYVEGEIRVRGSVNVDERTVTFPHVLPKGQQYAFEQYYIGEFTGNFSGYNPGSGGDQSVNGYIKDILARLLVKAWGEEERNWLLDIRNIMQDSDFKIMSNDKILKSKNEWIDQLDAEIYNYQNRLAWQIRFMNGSRRLGRG